MSQLSSRDIETLRPDVDRAVEKVLGNSHNDVLTTIEKCLSYGYDRKRTIEKLTNLIDNKKANRLIEKIDDLLDQYKTVTKGKKRLHADDNNETSDTTIKKLRPSFEQQPKVSLPPPAMITPPVPLINPLQMSAAPQNVGSMTSQQISAMMANAQREIEERKKALSALKTQQDHQPPQQQPSIQSTVPAITILATQPIQTTTTTANSDDADRDKRIAFLQAQIKAKLSGSLNAIIPAQPQEKPKPLILDEQGRTVDNAGRAVALPTLAPTLKANIRAKRKETFTKTTQQNEKKIEEEGTKFIDERITVKPAIRTKRSLRFHEPGKFQQMAEKLRMKAQLEKLQNEISQIARKTGISSATKLALIAPKQDSHADDVPQMEWWDSVILSNDLSTMKGDKIAIRESAITNLIEHPTQMKPPSKCVTFRQFAIYFSFTLVAIMLTILIVSFLQMNQ